MFSQNEAADPFLGKEIHGYRLDHLLGRGAMTAVYRAHARERGQVPELIVTMLLVPETLPERTKQRFQERFLQEAGQIEHLHHPNICPMYGYGEQDGYCYVLSPALEGETLLALMRHRQRWTPQEVLYLLSPIANAFEYLHSQGRAWQFFTPANVIVLKDMTLSIEPIQLTGLGLLAMLRLQGLEEIAAEISTCAHLKSIAGTYPGSPDYLAPEIVKGAEGDGRSDIYALGILLFRLLSGCAPFDGESYLEIAQKHVYETLPSLHERAPDLPAAMELVINRALQRHPDFRYQRPGDLVTAYMHIVKERLQQPERLDISRRIVGLPPLPTPVFAERFRLPAATSRIVPATDEAGGSSLAAPRTSDAELGTDEDAAWETALPQAEKHGVQSNIQKLLTSLKGVTLFSRTQIQAEAREAQKHIHIEEGKHREEQATPSTEKEEAAARENIVQERRQHTGNVTPLISTGLSESADEDKISEKAQLAQNGPVIPKHDMDPDIAAMSSYLRQLKERLQAQTKPTGEQVRQSAEPGPPVEQSEEEDAFPVWLN